MENPKTYLGDGVYAEHDGYQVWIWTSDGVQESPRIALEPAVIKLLLEFSEKPCDWNGKQEPRRT